MTVKEVINDKILEIPQDPFLYGLKIELYTIGAFLTIGMMIYFVPKIFSMDVSCLFLVGLLVVLMAHRIGKTVFRIIFNFFCPQNFTRENAGEAAIQIPVFATSLGIFLYITPILAPEHISTTYSMLQLVMWIAFMASSLSFQRMNSFEEKNEHIIRRSEIIVAPRKKYWIFIAIYYVVFLILLFIFKQYLTPIS